MLVLMPDSISEENLIEQSTKKEIKTNAEFRAFNKLIVIKEQNINYGFWYVQVYDDYGNHEETMTENLIQQLFRPKNPAQNV
jgi:hypothetical protein